MTLSFPSASHSAPTSDVHTWQGAPYDPKHDPLVDATPGHGRQYAPTYWVDTAGPVPEDDGPVSQDIDVDVVIVGSGYTGLSCAIHLAEEHGIKATILEANRVAWGCSTRNGGQAQISAGRLKRSQWIQRWGVDIAKQMHAEISEGFDLFNHLISRDDINCDPQVGGHFYIAHRPKVMAKLVAEANLLNSTFGYNAKILSREELHAEHVKDQEAAGAMYEPDGTSIHAGKLAFDYQRLARKLGAKIHTSSPVLGWECIKGVYHIQTPGGTVRARALALATAGYTPPKMNNVTKNRLLPILSNSLVTRPLTDEEITACGLKTYSPLTDTRTLRHYYRLLPDNRVQIGSRSAIYGKDAPQEKHLALLKKGLYRKFPILTDIQIDYSWWGWVDVSHDMMPRITRPHADQQLFYAMGYGGNGVMYSAQAGRRLAQLVAGKGETLRLPIFTSELPGYGLLTPFRRLGQRFAYGWYYLTDELI